MKFDLLRRVLDRESKKVASSSKSRSLRVESLEDRELLDASGVVGLILPADLNVATVAGEEQVGQKLDETVDLGDFTESATTTSEASKLDAPAVLELGEYDAEAEKLPMQWSSVDDAEKYRIEYTTNGGKTWKLGAIVDGDVTSRLASKVHMGLEYIFRIQASNETSVSEWTYSEPFYYSNSIPDAPGEFRLGEYDSSTKTLTMDWDKVDYSFGYRVQYSMDGGTSWYNSETLEGVDSTSRTARRVYADRGYQFRVSAYNSVGFSEWTYSDEFCVNDGELDSPGSVVIGDYDATTRTLNTSWGAVENATGYEVQFSLDQGKTWRLAQKLYDGDQTSRAATHVIPGTTYEFRVRAFNPMGVSDWAYSDLYTPPALLTAPAFLQCDSYDPLTRLLELSWGDVPDEDGYKVEYSTDGGATWTVAFKTEADVTTGVAEEIKPGVSYLFHVRAYNETDVSPWTETSFCFSEEYFPQYFRRNFNI